MKNLKQKLIDEKELCALINQAQQRIGDEAFNLLKIITQKEIEYFSNYGELFKISEKCFWYERSKDPNSTTFQEVRANGGDHILGECLDCSGQVRDCVGYKVLKRGRK